MSLQLYDSKFESVPVTVPAVHSNRFRTPILSCLEMSVNGGLNSGKKTEPTQNQIFLRRSHPLYLCSVTSVLLLLLCYFRSVTSALLLLLCYFRSVTSALLLLLLL